MGMLQSNDQLAKVAVVRDKDTPLALRNCEHSEVGKTGRILSTNPGRIMTEPAEIHTKARIGTLIEEKPHRCAAGTER
jgi:hypothetical protein